MGATFLVKHPALSNLVSSRKGSSSALRVPIGNELPPPNSSRAIPISKAQHLGLPWCRRKITLLRLQQELDCGSQMMRAMPPRLAIAGRLSALACSLLTSSTRPKWTRLETPAGLHKRQSNPWPLHTVQAGSAGRTRSVCALVAPSFKVLPEARASRRSGEPHGMKSATTSRAGACLKEPLHVYYYENEQPGCDPDVHARERGFCLAGLCQRVPPDY